QVFAYPMNVCGWNEQSLAVQAGMIFTHAHVKDILFCICAYYKQRFWVSTKVNTPALSDGIEMCAVVFTYNFSCGRLQEPGRGDVFKVFLIVSIFEYGGIGW